MQFKLNRSSPQSLYSQLAQDIQSRIRSGALPPGARLPTVRELASQLGVTRLTVHSAYSELQAGGWVEATVGRGTFVAAQAESAALLPEAGRDLSPPSILSDMQRMARLPGIRSMAMADAAPDLYPTRDFGRALEEALSSGGSAKLQLVARRPGAAHHAGRSAARARDQRRAGRDCGHLGRDPRHVADRAHTGARR